MDYREPVKHMSIREKARLVTGADFWHTWGPVKYGMPSLSVSDGPNGLRKMDGAKTITAVCFPSATAMAASWDKRVLNQVGGTLADDCRANRVSVLLGPGINIKRSPLCGRNFEYYSEDPVLAGELAASFIKGVQKKGVGTSLKHFAANSTESRRMVSNSLVDDRALREIYLRGFEIAVKKAQPWTVMMAYNKLNGTFCSENSWLMEDVLRGEWGFRGLTVSDWMAVNDRVTSLENGLDLEMPGSGYYNVRKIAKAFRSGKFDLTNLEIASDNVADLVNKAEPLLKEPKPERDLEGAHQVSAKVAESCPVLLKNNGILPIRPGMSVAILGERAEKPLYQGAGSAGINSYKVISVLDAFKTAGTPFVYAKGYDIKHDTTPDYSLLGDASVTAMRADVALVFVSCSEIDAAEGADRKTMGIPAGQAALIETACRANPNTVVVLTTGSCVEMPWVDLPAAIMQTYFLGEAQGTAVYRLLTGAVSPSGKLPETYPVRFEDTPCPDNYKTQPDNNIIYKESIYVGYRYYEKAKVPVLFPFGYGLSYTTFDYSDIRVSANSITPKDKIRVTFTVRNTGAFDGAETAQLYVGKKDTLVYRAVKELKGFKKVFLRAGEAKEVSIDIDRSAFEYYSTTLKSWVVEEGVYTIFVGSSSADIRLRTRIKVQSGEAKGEIDYMKAAPRYWAADIKNVSEDDFADIFGAYPSEFVRQSEDDRITREYCLDELWDNKRGAKILPWLDLAVSTVFYDNPAMYEVIMGSIVTIPLKRFAAISHGALSDEMVDAIVHFFNTGRLGEVLKVGVAGVPGAALNLGELFLRDFIDKKSRK